MSTIRSILIDPQTRTVTESQVEPALEPLYAALGCDMVESLDLGGQIDGIVDEEGLHKDDQTFFGFHGRQKIIAGRMLVVGVDGAEWTDLPTRVTVKDILLVIRWVDPTEARRAAQDGQFDCIITSPGQPDSRVPFRFPEETDDR